MDHALIEKIVQEVIRRLKAETTAETALGSQPPPRKVIVEADVLEAVKRGEKVIRAQPKAIITPLARDAMREKGVSVEIVESQEGERTK